MSLLVQPFRLQALSTSQDAQTFANLMVKSCVALLDIPSFLGLVDFVLTLPKHCYSPEDCPNDAWEYDRKIWSHHCVVCRLTVKHDATNYVLFFCILLIPL